MGYSRKIGDIFNNQEIFSHSLSLFEKITYNSVGGRNEKKPLFYDLVIVMCFLGQLMRYCCD